VSREKREFHTPVQTPFLRPLVSDTEVTMKLMDNGIQTNLKRTRVRGHGQLELVLEKWEGAAGI